MGAYKLGRAAAAFVSALCCTGLLLVYLSAARGQALAANANPKPAVDQLQLAGKNADDGHYRIAPFDVLSLYSKRALPDQAITGKYQVHPNGEIRLGLYGPVTVSGLTLEKARDKIAQYLSTFIREPQVAVDVASYTSRFVQAFDAIEKAREVVEARRTALREAEQNLRREESRLERLKLIYGRPEQGRE